MVCPENCSLLQNEEEDKELSRIEKCVISKLKRINLLHPSEDLTERIMDRILEKRPKHLLYFNSD